MISKDSNAEILILGAGAAGLAASVFCARSGMKVILIDRKEKIGAKILMSGGTRCNITNEKVLVSDYATGTPLTVRNILNAFTSAKAVEFFREIGVETVLEDKGKYFPSTHSGRTVLEALIAECRRLSVEIRTGQLVQEIRYVNNEFLTVTESGTVHSAKVMLATGGLSFPATGSDGTGYAIAKAFGHTLVETSPSLTPLKTGDPDWKELSGISTEVRLTLKQDQTQKTCFDGSMLFTHFGFSGPVVLNISRYWIRSGDKQNIRLEANFLPAWKKEDFEKKMLTQSRQSPGMSVKNYLDGFLPERLAEKLSMKSGIQPRVTLNQCTREQRDRLMDCLFHCPLKVNGDLGYAKAEVTAGGVDLKEVDSKTLESKKQPGLYLIGEILDVDGRIGGFNFQWAWASAFAAAQSAAGKGRETKG